MKTTDNIGFEVDRWIREEELPVNGRLKVISRYDDLYPEDPEESEAYWDFIHWAMNREHAILMSLPQPKGEDFFPPIQLDEMGHDISPYNTMDFKRLHQFDKNRYRLKMISARVRDLAQTYSAISSREGKQKTHDRFRALIEKEFRSEVNRLLDRIRKESSEEKQAISAQIMTIYQQIRTCERIWQQHAAEGG